LAFISRTRALGLTPWLLLDGAMLSAEQYQRLVRLNWGLSPALAGTAFEAYGRQGPLLLRPDEDDSAKLSLALSVANAKPALSLLAARRDEAAMCAALAWLADAGTADGQRLHCRFADSRVTEPLLATLTPAQAHRLGQDLAYWAWVHRDGTLAMHELPTAPETTPPPQQPPAQGAFELSASQYSQLLEAAEPDMVLQMLADNCPDLLGSENSPCALHARLVALLAAARGHGLEDLPDLYQFAVVALSTRDDFDQHPALQDTWRQTRERSGRFADLAQAWPSSLWAALNTAPPATPAPH
jgi:hypothetical protein